MLEIVLIILCVTAAGRFRKAGEKGVGKYIAGVWCGLFGCIIVGSMIMAATESTPVFIVFILAGYITAFACAISAMKAGKGYLDYYEKQKNEEINKEKAQLTAKIAELETRQAACERVLPKEPVLATARPIPSQISPTENSANKNPFWDSMDDGNRVYAQMIRDGKDKESQIKMASNLLFGKCGTALMSNCVFEKDVELLFKAIGWELYNANGREAMQGVFNNIMNRYPMLGVKVSEMWNDIKGWQK